MNSTSNPKVGTLITTRTVFAFPVDSPTPGPADPGTVTCTVVAPDGSASVYTAPEVVRDGTGQYHLDFPATAAGSWSAIWSGSGSGPIVVDFRRITVTDVPAFTS